MAAHKNTISNFKKGDNVRDKEMSHLPGIIVEVGKDYLYVQFKKDHKVKYLLKEIKYLRKISN
jgi:hypothetical protein